MQMGDESQAIILFEEQPSRRIWYDGRWFYSIIDIVATLTRSTSPRRYWSDLKRKIVKESYTQLYEKIVQLKLISPDGKFYESDTGDAALLFLPIAGKLN